MDISLIIPTYNEAKNLPPLFEELAMYLRGEIVEFIVVDDNSPDGTAQVVKELMKKYPIRLIERPEKSGLGSAVRAGFAEAKGSIVGVMDADLSHDPVILPQMIAALRSGADIAIGSRFAKTSHVENWVWWRKLTSRCGVWAAQKLTRTEDPLSGFFLMKKEVIAKTLLTTTGYKILLEILVKGSYKVVKEFPFTFRMRKFSVSKLSGKEYLLFTSQVIRYGALRIWSEHRLFLGVLTVGLLILIFGLRQSLWLDEGLSWSFAQDNIKTIVSRSIYTDLHPPLYYLFLHSLLVIIPPSPTLLRLVSAVAYIIFSLALYRRLRNSHPEKSASLIASSLVPVVLSPFILHYAGELRSSLVVILLSFFQWNAFERFLIQAKERKKVSISFIVWSVLLLYTFYPIIFVLVGQLVFAVFRQVPWKPTLRSLAIIFAFYFPWIYILAQVRLHENPGHFLTIPWWQIPAIVGVGFTGGRVAITDLHHLHWYWPTAFVCVALLMVILAIMVACRYAWQQTRPLFVVGGIAFALALFVSAVKVSFFDPRYHVTLYPIFALLVAEGFVVLLSRWKKIGLSFLGIIGVAYLVTFSLYLFHPLYGREPWREAVEALGAKTQPGDVVLFYGVEGNEPPPSFRIYQTSPIEIRATYPNLALGDNKHPEVLAHVENVINNHDRVWLTQFLAWQKDPEEVIRTLVASRCVKKESVGYFKVVFDLYECSK